jgi:hypothetical protein
MKIFKKIPSFFAHLVCRRIHAFHVVEIRPEGPIVCEYLCAQALDLVRMILVRIHKLVHLLEKHILLAGSTSIGVTG